MNDLTARLVQVGSGAIAHDWRGGCPDDINGFDARDSQCPACRVLIDATSRYCTKDA